MQKIIILLIAFSFVGWIPFGGKYLQQSRSSQHSERSLHEVPISNNVTLNVANIWPLKMSGTYLQKLHVSTRGKQHSFSVYLSLSDTMVEVVAFNDMAGRLYKMKWTPQDIVWEGSSYIPSIIKPENIIADFLLIHLPADQLQNMLYGAYVYEQGDETTKFRVIQSREVLRNISYDSPFGNMWGHVTINNPALDYRFDIQTVGQ